MATKRLARELLPLVISQTDGRFFGIHFRKKGGGIRKINGHLDKDQSRVRPDKYGYLTIIDRNAPRRVAPKNQYVMGGRQVTRRDIVDAIDNLITNRAKTTDKMGLTTINKRINNLKASLNNGDAMVEYPSYRKAHLNRIFGFTFNDVVYKVV